MKVGSRTEAHDAYSREVCWKKEPKNSWNSTDFRRIFRLVSSKTVCRVRLDCNFKLKPPASLALSARVIDMHSLDEFPIESYKAHSWHEESCEAILCNTHQVLCMM